MNDQEKLIAYIRSLTKEQAEEAFAIASAWLEERQEAKQHPQQTVFL